MDERSKEIVIRTMTIEDYDKVYALWMSCRNMGFNNLMIPGKGLTGSSGGIRPLPLWRKRETGSWGSSSADMTGGEDMSIIRP